MRKYISIPTGIGIIGGLIMAAAGVSPTEAASNLAAWYNWIWSKEVPEWLNTASADKYGFVFGCLLLLISIVAFLYASKTRRKLSVNATSLDDVNPDASVRWLFHYMLTDSTWALGRASDLPKERNPGSNLYHNLQADLGDAAKLGALTVWARPKDRGGFKPRIFRFEPERWATLYFDLPTCMGAGDSPIISDWTGDGRLIYDDAQVNKAQVLRLWPKASLWQRLSDKTRTGRLKFVDKETPGDVDVAR